MTVKQFHLWRPDRKSSREMMIVVVVFWGRHVDHARMMATVLVS